jgi:tRNA threonylcarbamoyladenosine biosynthesis protein TsaB
VIILSIKTDQPESEFALYSDHTLLAATKYLAHRDLAQTIHIKIAELLKQSKLSLKDIEGIICFKGPGSFTGLRIGLTVANSLSYGLNIPIVGSKGPNWQTKAIDDLANHKNQKTVLPFYGSEPHITQPKK